MMKSAIVGLVEFCTGRPLWIVVLAVALAGGSAFYAARHFAIKTNVNDLISRDQPWTQRGIQFLNDFPQRDIIIVVDAPTPELVEQASAKLAAALRQHSDRFPAVSEPGSGSFFERNGLLFLPENEVVRVTDGLSRADLLIGAVLIPGAKAPSLVRAGDLKRMPRRAVIIDVAIDQGGCVETARPTTHSRPTYIVDDVVHYCVTNMPGAVGRTSTYALTNVTLPYVLQLVRKGFEKAVSENTALAQGVNIRQGRITNPAVAETFHLPCAPVL